MKRLVNISISIIIITIILLLLSLSLLLCLFVLLFVAECRTRRASLFVVCGPAAATAATRKIISIISHA